MAYKLWLKVRGLSGVVNDLKTSMAKNESDSRADLAISDKKLEGCDVLLKDLAKEDRLKDKEIDGLTKAALAAQIEFDKAKGQLDHANAMLKEGCDESASIKMRITDVKVSERVRVRESE